MTVLNVLNLLIISSVIKVEVDRELHRYDSNACDRITTAIERYKHHLSIIKLSQENFPKCSFEFYHISESNMLKLISESYQTENIPPKFLYTNL